MNNDPLRTLSRRTEQSVENSPETLAFREGRYVTPNTWGAYATRAIDLGLCEPSVEAVYELFGGRQYIDLNDDALYFTHPQNFNNYRAWFLETKEAEHLKDIQIEVDRLCSLAKEIMSQWQIDSETGKQQAKFLQEGIERLVDSLDQDEQALNALCMLRDGLRDGYQVTIDEFARQMLSANVLDEEFHTELWAGWIAGVRETLEDIMRDYSYVEFETFDANKMHVPYRAFVAGMLGSIKRAGYEAVREKAYEDWARIEPVFLTPRSLSVLDGTEK